MNRGNVAHALPESSRGLHVGIIDLTPPAAGGEAARMFACLISAAASLEPALPCDVRTLSFRQPPEALDQLDRDVLAGFDALVVTGTEPTSVEIVDDPMLPVVSRIVESARPTVRSMLLSCFAAHAALTVLGGVPRHRLETKHVGVFPHLIAEPDHPLAIGLQHRMPVPHSRWNSVDQRFLADAGISPVIVEETGQWHVAADPEARSVFVQGHPEYFPETLYREYRRDVRRFLGAQSSWYPDVPDGYFGTRSHEDLDRFRQWVDHNPDPAAMARFPTFDACVLLQSWSGPSVRFMRNWLAAVRDAVAA